MLERDRRAIFWQQSLVQHFPVRRTVGALQVFICDYPDGAGLIAFHYILLRAPASAHMKGVARHRALTDADVLIYAEAVGA